MKHYSNLIIILFLLFSSCTFNPSGENFQQVGDPKQPETAFTIDLDSPSNSDDVIPIAKPTTIEYQFESKKNRLLIIEVRINKELKYEFQRNSGSFDIHPSSFSTGTHLLEFTIFLGSESGSLADNLDREVFEIKKSYSFAVDNDPTTPVNIVSIKPAPEGLKISWEAYDRVNFRRYEVYKTDAPLDRDYTATANRVGAVYKSDSTSIIDISQLGRQATYWVEVHANDVAEGEKKDFVGVTSNLEVIDSTATEVNLAWTKSLFSKVFGEYRLISVEDAVNNFHAYPIDISTNVTDTTATLKPPFPGPSLMILESFAKSGTLMRSRDTVQVSSGTPSITFSKNDNFFYDKQLSTSFLLREHEVTEFDKNTGAQLNNIKISLAKPSKDFFIGIDKNSTTDQRLSIISRSSLQIVKSYSTSELFGESLLITKTDVPLNGNIVLIQTQKGENSTEANLHLVNYETGELLETFENSASDVRFMVSHDNKYFIYNTGFYTIKNNKPVLQRTIESLGPRYGTPFFDNQNSEIYYFISHYSTGFRFWIYDSKSHDTETYYQHSMGLENLHFNKSELILTAEGKYDRQLYTFSLPTGDFKTTRLNTISPYFRYFKDMLLSSNGYKIPYSPTP